MSVHIEASAGWPDVPRSEPADWSHSTDGSAYLFVGDQAFERDELGEWRRIDLDEREER